MPAANQSQIDLTDPAAIQVTREPVASNVPELLPKAQITGVFPIKINSKPAAPDDANWTYRFDDIICVAIHMSDGGNPDGHIFTFEIQEITNQPGWTADLAGQQQCVADILASL